MQGENFLAYNSEYLKKIDFSRDYEITREGNYDVTPKSWTV